MKKSHYPSVVPIGEKAVPYVEYVPTKVKGSDLAQSLYSLADHFATVKYVKIEEITFSEKPNPTTNCDTLEIHIIYESSDDDEKRPKE